MQLIDKKYAPIGVAALIAISIILWTSFLGASAVSGVNVLTTKGFAEMLEKASSVNFILFALLLPLTISLVSLLAFYFDRVKAYATAFGAELLGLVVLVALNGFDVAGIVTAFFFGAGTVALLEFSYLKKEEYKKLVTFRTTSSAAKVFFVLLAVGVFLGTAALAYGENEKNVKEFGDTVMELAFRPIGGGEGLSEKLADVLIQSQSQALQQITATPQFQKLRGKEDVDVQTFVLLIDKTQENVNSPLARARIVEELNKQMQSATEVLNFDVLRKQSPMLESIAQNYWLILAFTFTSFFTLIANLILANLAGIYAAVMRKIIETVQRQG